MNNTTTMEEKNLKEILMPAELVLDLEAQIINQLKDLFAITLSAQRERLVEEVEGMKKNTPFELSNVHTIKYEKHYNQALDDIIKLIKELK